MTYLLFFGPCQLDTSVKTSPIGVSDFFIKYVETWILRKVFVEVKFALDEIQQARKTLFKTIAIEERDGTQLC